MEKDRIKQFWEGFTLILKYRIISFIPITLIILGFMFIVIAIIHNRIVLSLLGIIKVALGTMLMVVKNEKRD